MSTRKTGLCAGMVLSIVVGGCNSFDKKPEDENQPRLVIPVDERAALTAPVTPPPVSGGTLSVLSDNSVAIVADPERDRISIVDLNSSAVRTIALQAGDEPGRIVEDSQRHVHVALRRAGAIVSIDPASGAVLNRRAVCKAPRGVAFESATGLLHVACSEGKLVSLPAQGGDVVRTLSLDSDLRDVLVRNDELWVTRFKSAEILRVSSAGAISTRVQIPQGHGQLSKPSESTDFSTPPEAPRDVTLQPGVAWRAIGTSTGGAMLVHQDTVNDEVSISPPSASGSSYGGGSGPGCDGIVKNVLSTVAANGSVVSAQFSGAPLPVDVALSPDQKWIAVAHAGIADMDAPRPFLVFPGDGQSATAGKGAPVGFGQGVSVLSTTNLNANGGNNCNFSQGSTVMGAATAVAFTTNNRLVVQTREPAQLIVLSDLPFGPTSTIDLGGDSRADTGRDLFHSDAGGGIACASCHPEGGEDGHTWRFSGFGDRRTQALHVGLRDTAPFHWAGDLPNVGALMNEVFVGRMGGVRENDARVSALSEWLFSLKAPPSIRDAQDEAAQRGQALFQSADVGCTTCHSGPKLTDNRSVSIDSAAKDTLQVPSLIAVGYRAPFMHNGCAATLLDRFDTKCGGDKHGNIAGLTDAQRHDLVAYLESL